MQKIRQIPAIPHSNQQSNQQTAHVDVRYTNHLKNS